MAESIITLGIGATPTNLTPFITTGLFSAALDTLEASDQNIAFFIGKNRAQVAPFSDRVALANYKARAQAAPIKHRVQPAPIKNRVKTL